MTLTQSKTVVRLPVPCGFDHNLEAGREPCQLGWYEFVGSYIATETATDLNRPSILDVGTGVSYEGLRLLRDKASTNYVGGIDVDKRLTGLHDSVVVRDISEMGDLSVDFVTCFDVIEHVVDDLTFLRNLLRVARRGVFVTTPNFTRSRCQNHHHCRELTIPEFLLHYRPSELWVASPDGYLNRRQVAEKVQTDPPMYRTLHDGEIYPESTLSGLSLASTSVDGQEWPHMLGVWRGSLGDVAWC
jgi:hypothetical protein